ncbi:putative F-box domain, Zinc finger, MYND-type, tetratricopeptide-like helical [Heracleum sosnowskyi]|uniref:F-box domain, Zinc finger, MYND-type, tetratricopeptide-like helical n=1 Tax=Heracleum sosnowskyi TaxID=360622 RepID=A0AAD8IBS0_9APIA|nr:putative F-box domain, Zinc finger, MYND-type, tetratricopeptide-like helical [Heracleum sosnowskyi]
MRTRRGLCYPRVDMWSGKTVAKRLRDFSGDLTSETCRKRHKKIDFLDNLPDDLVLTILSKLSSSAACPADFGRVLVTCKRLNDLGLRNMVLAKASPKVFAVKACRWSESTHRFFKKCAEAGNVEACYTLGMIRFYCLNNRGTGASLLAKAAIKLHAPALYALAVIQFNGSGGSKTDKDLRAGVALCARAAFLGHIDALRELGHCLQDGYGVRQNITEGRRFLVQANARELAAVLNTAPEALTSTSWLVWNPLPNHRHVHLSGCSNCPLLSDFGCNVPESAPQPANQFLTDWFNAKSPGPGLRLCSHVGCGRPESRRHEFRRCSVCGKVNYCSRACQALDWRTRHKSECTPTERWEDDHDGEGDNVVNGAGEVMDES